MRGSVLAVHARKDLQGGPRLKLDFGHVLHG